MIKVPKYYLYLFFCILLVLVFSHNEQISLWDQDEAAYAGFAKNMIESNDWLIPKFMWSDIHRKPPLHFWSIALSYKMFGINEFSVRLPAALSIVFTFLLVYFQGRKVFGNTVSFNSVIVLSTTLFVPILAKVSVTDATLLFFSTACAFAILQILQNKGFIYVITFWISFALALLTKGPPIIIFCSVFVTILLIFHPNRKTLRNLHPWFFLPLALAPLIIWGYLTTQHDNGAFIDWMIDWYILRRINGSVLGQTGPPGMHLLFIIVFFVPYLMFLPKALSTGIRGIWTKDPKNVVLGAWFISGWLIYEFSPSKLPAYCVVAHIPLAILIGKTLVSNVKPIKSLIILQFLIMLTITGGLLGLSYYIQLSITLKLSLILFNLLMIVGVIIVFKQLHSSKFISSVIGLNLFFQLVIILVLLPQVASYKNSTKRVAYFIKKNAHQESVIVLANKTGQPPSLPFYISLFSDHVIEENNIELMSTQFQSENPYVFVLDKIQKEQFVRQFPKLEYQQIQSFFTDRTGKASYYIVINDVSKQNKN